MRCIEQIGGSRFADPPYALETDRVSGSFSGEAMFKAKARLKLPADIDVEALRTSLEAIANELMMDLDLEAA